MAGLPAAAIAVINAAIALFITARATALTASQSVGQSPRLNGQPAEAHCSQMPSDGSALRHRLT